MKSPIIIYNIFKVHFNMIGDYLLCRTNTELIVYVMFLYFVITVLNKLSNIYLLNIRVSQEY